MPDVINPDAELRQRLIDEGLLRPGCEGELRRVALPDGTPVLRLDQAGREAVIRPLTSRERSELEGEAHASRRGRS
jgi:hypothetical protein